MVMEAAGLFLLAADRRPLPTRPGPRVQHRVQRMDMLFWQLTIDANDPAVLARFWAQALGYQPVPPTEPATTWHALYHARLGEDAAFDDRLFDPAGLRPPI